MGDFNDVVWTADDAFGEEEASSKLFVFAGGAHGNGDGMAAHAYFQGFFNGEGVGRGFWWSVRGETRNGGVNAWVHRFK